MKLYRCSITLCAGCISGEGQECHSPGCYLYHHRIDLPINVDEPIEIGEVEDTPRELEQLNPEVYAWPGEDWP